MKLRSMMLLAPAVLGSLLVPARALCNPIGLGSVTEPPGGWTPVTVSFLASFANPTHILTQPNLRVYVITDFHWQIFDDDLIFDDLLNEGSVDLPPHTVLPGSSYAHTQSVTLSPADLAKGGGGTLELIAKYWFTGYDYKLTDDPPNPPPPGPHGRIPIPEPSTGSLMLTAAALMMLGRLKR